MGRISIRKRISLMVAAAVVAGSVAFADGSKSCITDVKLSNDGSNVKVNIYTDKPYGDSVVVSKKEGNRYVILVPETTSTLKSPPKVVGGGNVSVSMHSVDAGRGYTKITITSDKAINIIPKTITSTHTTPTVQPQAKPAQKPVTENKTATCATQSKPIPKTIASGEKPVIKQVKTKDTVKQQVPAPAAKPVVKSQAKPIQPVAKPSNAPVDDMTRRNKPMDILEQQVVTDKIPDVKETKPDALLEQAIKDNEAIIKQRKLKKRKSAAIVDGKLSPKGCFELVLDEVKTLSLWKLLMLASAITFPIIVIMIILGLDKRINKRIKAVRKEDDVKVMERALKENVMAVRAQKESDAYSSIDEMLNKVQETPSVADGYDVFANQGTTVYSDVVESDFEIGHAPELVDEIPINGSDKDSLENGISLADFEMADFGTDRGDFVSKPTQLMPFNPDGVLADYSSVDDKEFFDELVLRSFAVTDLNCLPDNLPADEIFDVMTESDAGTKLTDFEHANFEQDQTETSYMTKDTDGIRMLNEAKINDKTGLYLVDYENFSSLVGHIEDEYFVIKRFDKFVNGNIILKQAEKTEESTKYLVRVGQDKMIVEVGSNSMSRLIDL